MKSPVRVRFARSPTGFMHLGSVRVAFLNYLFARKHQGTFVLRIEDTDASRNLDEARTKIVEDLAWLGLPYQEGPVVGGKCGPYLQSERNDIYQEQLQALIENCKVYRCFCSAEELEAKRQKQMAMGKPPRYDRTCLQLSDDKIKAKIAADLPFIWRFKLNYDQLLEIKDLARGTISFEMKHFSDFALTRPDGTCTFMFANFVDDWLMNITHVIRGEDHLSNTALQAALFDAFALPLPTYWHLQIICNKEGEKLSKRDFGFSLEDLKQAGYLPVAILNYMGTAGVSFAEEVQSLEELAKNYPFESLHHTGNIRYDVDKLTWFNHKWLNRLDAHALLAWVKPILHAALPASTTCSDDELVRLIAAVKSDLQVLPDIVNALRFVFNPPAITPQQFVETMGEQVASAMQAIIAGRLDASTPQALLDGVKADATARGLKVKEAFSSLRFVLTGATQGVGMQELMTILPAEEIKRRFMSILPVN